MRWRSLALGAIAAAIVGILAWQIWDAHWQPASKWMDSDRPDCQVWDSKPQRNETVTWTGACQSGKAHGDGLVTWHYTDRTGEPQTETYSGPLQAGKANGEATVRYPDGARYDGEFQDGKKSGHGVYAGLKSKYDGAWKNGKPNGFGTYTDDAGSYAGQWKDGCLDDKGEVIAISGSADECRRILAKN